MKAQIQLLDLLLSVVLPLTKSPDAAISAVATDELQQLAKRRAALLKRREKEAQPEGAGQAAALAA
jgi:hypothetical protein